MHTTPAPAPAPVTTPITLHAALQDCIDPLTPGEYAALERSLLAEGCRDALVLWGHVLVDGHNRYALCQQHGLPFQTVQNPHFTSLEDVQLWLIDQHLGRRSVSDFQRGVLALRKRDLVAARRSRAPVGSNTSSSSAPGSADAAAAEASASTSASEAPLHNREAIARAARLSSHQVVLIEKIRQQAAPEVVAALKAGSISLRAAAAVASLPAEEQVAAAVAGQGELKQAARRVRESRRKPRAAEAQAAGAALPVAGAADAADAAGAIAAEATALPCPAASAARPGADAAVQALQQRVAELTAENQALRQQLAGLQTGH